MRYTLVALSTIVAAAGIAPADTISVPASKDNSIYFSDTPLSNGQGEGLFCGMTGIRGGFMVIRSLIAFDVSTIPAGSTVTGVSVQLSLDRASPFGGDETLSLFRLTTDWGEGTSVAFGGTGAAATPGDATWQNNVFPDSFWTNPGGDFAAPASGTATVGVTPGPYFWNTAGLVADVQGWLDHPGTNFGWMLIGNEAVQYSAKNFASRESTLTTFRPVLTVDFSPPVECPGDWNHDDVLNSQDYFDFLQDFFAFDADFNGDNVTNSQDFFDFLTAFFTGC